MKKVLIYLCLAAGLVSCAKEMAPVEDAPAGVPVTFNVTVSNGPGTKAAKTDWATGDVIYVFFQNIGEKYLALTYNGSGWDESCPAGDLLDTDFAGVSDYFLAAVHFPVPVEVNTSGATVLFQEGTEPVMSYYLESMQAYMVNGATVTATLSLAKPTDVVLFHIPGIQDDLSDYTFCCEQVFALTCEVSKGEAIILKDYIILPDCELPGFADADGAIFAAAVRTADPEDYTFTLKGPGKTYTLTRKAKVLEPGKMYEFPPLDDLEWYVEGDDTMQFVDLDLPSGTFWATTNLGASAPHESGDYFAWGELEPKDTYTLDNYRFWDASSTSYTKYFGDGLTILQAEDDAAQAFNGGAFIPTEEQYQELIDNCVWDWVSDFEGTGVSGYVVSSKTDPAKQIFLPAAGAMNGSILDRNNERGYYWTANVSKQYSDAVRILYTDVVSFSKQVGQVNPHLGCTIRPVLGGGSSPDEPGFINGYPYVDMGNGLKWATMNLGSYDPSEGGDFFAWGETEPSVGYGWSSYKWASIPDGVVDSEGWKYLTRYTYDDGNTSACWYDVDGNYTGENDLDFSSHDYEDDAARQVWGATWRTPTTSDWYWLIDNCTWTWVDNYEGTSASGVLVTSNVEGFTDSKIFLPAVQHTLNTNFAGGDYWTSDINDSWGSSAGLYLHIANTEFGADKRISSMSRYEHLLIRPVSD